LIGELLLIKKRILQAGREKLKISSIKVGLPAAKNSVGITIYGSAIKIQ